MLDPDLTDIYNLLKQVLDWQTTHSLSAKAIHSDSGRAVRKIDKLAHLLFRIDRKLDLILREQENILNQRKEHLFDPDWDKRMFED